MLEEHPLLMVRCESPSGALSQWRSLRVSARCSAPSYSVAYFISCEKAAITMRMNVESAFVWLGVQPVTIRKFPIACWPLSGVLCSSGPGAPSNCDFRFDRRELPDGWRGFPCIVFQFRVTESTWCREHRMLFFQFQMVHVHRQAMRLFLSLRVQRWGWLHVSCSCYMIYDYFSLTCFSCQAIGLLYRIACAESKGMRGSLFYYWMARGDPYRTSIGLLCTIPIPRMGI